MFILTAYWIFYTIAHSAQVKTEDERKVSGLYDGAQVWKVKLRNSEDIVLVQDLMNKQEVSIWKLYPKQAMFLVKMENKVKVNRHLTSQGLNHTVVIMDVQRRIDDQKTEPDTWDHKTLRLGHRMNWRKYPTVEVVHEFMTYLAKNYPSVCKQKVIGMTAKNTTIKMLTISNGNPQNKGILLVSGSHAREWMAITSALFILREIATKFDDQPEFVKDKDWHVIPLLNPDGFKYSYKHDRFWRKNRSKNYKTRCKGVDINRNFGIDWDVTDKKNPCNEVYGGPYSFSEAESIALRNTVEKLKRRLEAMVDFHSFGQMILFPWSARSRASKDDNLLRATAGEMRRFQPADLEIIGEDLIYVQQWTSMADMVMMTKFQSNAIFKFKRKKYSSGQTYHAIYPAGGSILDWMYSVGICHSYVIEGRDKGDHGFLMPPTFIQEAGQEMFIAVRRLASVIDRKFRPRGKKHYPWF